ncbi:hypothetical protein B0I35DRAFT_413191 [Stachybotrys elegans]|uniref:DUF3669 domain-containing protein n=1 Tax=Stachybotrys elegans TaxID=80388 RepID=A0A8K0WMC7_9HYPO|nr:hypothetical protein B0I35DRAFT_413191 [Stachybotrys elegans]
MADTTAQKWKEIGRGTFGVVFTTDAPDIAVKKTFNGSDKLATEFEHGLAASFAATTIGPLLRHEFPGPVPRVPWYQSSRGIQHPSKDAWWIANQGRLPSTNGDDVPNGVFLFERIPPVPRPLQEALIRRFWKTHEEQQAMLNDEDNRDCMIRPYLQERWAYYEGKGRRKRLNNEQKESLRNFPAYLDDLQRMGIDCHHVARQIALGLAVGHWEAQLDMTDVEYVIAGRSKRAFTTLRSHCIALYDKPSLDNRTIFPTAEEQQQQSYGLPANTQMWVVDFDKCSRVRVWDSTLSKDIRRLAEGINANDPYYPGPLPDTNFGWEVFITFTETYIKAGRCILRHTFEKVATGDEQLQHVLQRPAMVMREWTKIVMNAKKTQEREVYDARMKIRKIEGWEKPAWLIDKMA